MPEQGMINWAGGQCPRAHAACTAGLRRTGRRRCHAGTAAAALTKAARVSLPPKPPPAVAGRAAKCVALQLQLGECPDKGSQSCPSVTANPAGSPSSRKRNTRQPSLAYLAAWCAPPPCAAGCPAREQCTADACRGTAVGAEGQPEARVSASCVQESWLCQLKQPLRAARLQTAPQAAACLGAGVAQHLIRLPRHNNGGVGLKVEVLLQPTNHCKRWA